MSEARASAEFDERLLTFEVGGGVYALPIAWVVEVCTAEPLACIPTLPPEVAGVMNHHGDALPVLRQSKLLDLSRDASECTQVLVISARPMGGARLGLLVDRIVGLVDGAGAVSRDEGPVAERRPIGGRVVSVLDPARVVGRAGEVIERFLERGA